PSLADLGRTGLCVDTLLGESVQESRGQPSISGRSRRCLGRRRPISPRRTPGESVAACPGADQQARLGEVVEVSPDGGQVQSGADSDLASGHTSWAGANQPQDLDPSGGSQRPVAGGVDRLTGGSSPRGFHGG